MMLIIYYILFASNSSSRYPFIYFFVFICDVKFYLIWYRNNSLEEDKMLKSNPIQFYFTEGFDEDDANEINLDVKPSMHKLNTLDIENKLSNINSSVTDEETTTTTAAAADVKDNVTTT